MVQHFSAPHAEVAAVTNPVAIGGKFKIGSKIASGWNKLKSLTPAGKAATALGQKMGRFREILTKARSTKGNFGLGGATQKEAIELGESWVGKGFKTASDGKTLVSADGLRVFRPPSLKPTSKFAITGIQANFESRALVKINGILKTKIIGNGHLDIFP